MLVAVAIPVFTSQLEKSQQATDMANIRAAYAEASVNALDAADLKASKASVPMVHTGKFDKVDNTIVGGVDIKDTSVTKGKTVTVSVDGSTVTITPAT